jgi:hypothetical protein
VPHFACGRYYGGGYCQGGAVELLLRQTYCGYHQSSSTIIQTRRVAVAAADTATDSSGLVFCSAERVLTSLRSVIAAAPIDRIDSVCMATSITSSAFKSGCSIIRSKNDNLKTYQTSRRPAKQSEYSSNNLKTG